MRRGTGARPLRWLARCGLLACCLALLSFAVLFPPAPGSTPGRLASSGPAPSRPLPLAGRVVVLDPGHQLGNRSFPGQINRQVPAGGFSKPCNTTGTSTDGGYPEATFAFAVARLVAASLEDRGARVVLTRDRDSNALWGPCVDARGRAGNRLADGSAADLKLSIHADGVLGAGPGFHVIAPVAQERWTDDIAETSVSFARAVRRALVAEGLPVAAYTAGGDGLDRRTDLATLNLSDVPVVMAELGNMRSAEDARRMTNDRGRARYARALTAAVVAYLG